VGILSRTDGGVQFFRQNWLGTDGAGINGPALPTVNDEIGANSVQPAIRDETNAGKIGVVLAAEEGCVALGGFHFIEEASQREIESNREGHGEMYHAIGSCAAGAEPDFVDVIFADFERVGLPADGRIADGDDIGVESGQSQAARVGGFPTGLNLREVWLGLRGTTLCKWDCRRQHSQRPMPEREHHFFAAAGADVF
jgi:hypothetical protein